MKTLLCTLMLATLSVVASNADGVTIVLDQADQTGAPGDTLQFFGTITNTGDSTVFLNSDSFTIAGLSFTIDDQFYNTVPISLAPSGQAGDSSGDIELFDVSISDPLLDGPGTYGGTYTLLGGSDGGAQDVLGSVSFSVTPVPEPLAVYLLGPAALLLFLRKARNQARAA